MERKNVFDEYKSLLDKFIQGDISVGVFQLDFLKFFKNEKRMLDSELYNLLEEIFGDIESFTTDKLLLEENPAFYLDEEKLLERIKVGAENLRRLELNRSD